MSHVFQREIHHEFPRAVRGEGIRVVDSEGRRYLDASGGAAVSCLGHGHPDVIAAISARSQRSARLCAYGFFTSDALEELADMLVADAPAGLDKVYLRLGRLGGASRRRSSSPASISSRRRAAAPPFHRPPAELSRQHAGRARGRRQAVRGASRTRRCCSRRRTSRPATPIATSGATRPTSTMAVRVADELEAAILRLGPGDGRRLHRRAGGRRDARRGAAGRRLFQAHPRDLRPPRRAADPRRGDVRHGALRRRCFACEQEGVCPTSWCVAKGLGAGYQPIGARDGAAAGSTMRSARGSGMLPARPHLLRPHRPPARRRSRCSG